jgi:hypothetical protein
MLHQIFFTALLPSHTASMRTICSGEREDDTGYARGGRDGRAMDSSRRRRCAPKPATYATSQTLYVQPYAAYSVSAIQRGSANCHGTGHCRPCSPTRSLVRVGAVAGACPTRILVPPRWLGTHAVKPRSAVLLNRHKCRSIDALIYRPASMR